MALLKLCDICGRVETPAGDYKKAKKAKVYDNKPGALFDERPIRLQLPGHNGDRYNVSVEIKMEHEKDTVILDELYNTQVSSFIEKLFAGEESVEGAPTELSIDPLQAVTLNNPHPKICSSCKREILKLVMSYGSENGTAKI